MPVSRCQWVWSFLRLHLLIWNCGLFSYPIGRAVEKAVGREALVRRDLGLLVATMATIARSSGGDPGSWETHCGNWLARALSMFYILPGTGRMIFGFRFIEEIDQIPYNIGSRNISYPTKYSEVSSLWYIFTETSRDSIPLATVFS